MIAQQLADMANKAEAEILEAMTPAMRDWYLALPRERRVQISQEAFDNAFAALRCAA